MDAPDEMVEAVAQAAHDAECGEPETCTMTLEHYRDQARAVLSVPALAEVFARDAQVREIVQSMRTATVQGDVWAVVGRLSALYPEVASMLRDGKGVDNSDIMPGSEFDGPVVL